MFIDTKSRLKNQERGSLGQMRRDHKSFSFGGDANMLELDAAADYTTF